MALPLLNEAGIPTYLITYFDFTFTLNDIKGVWSSQGFMNNIYSDCYLTCSNLEVNLSTIPSGGYNMPKEAFAQNPINPSFELADSYVYQQYRHLEWCIKYFAIVDNLIQQYFVDTINDYIKAMSIQDSNSQYLTFYLKKFTRYRKTYECSIIQLL